MSVIDREKMVATTLLNCLSIQIIAKQLLAPKVTHTVQLVYQTSATTTAAGASEHSRSHRKKDAHFFYISVITS